MDDRRNYCAPLFVARALFQTVTIDCRLTMRRLNAPVILLILAALGRAVSIDNGLEASPAIVCGLNDIAVSIITEKPFGGNIYTKGFFEMETCRIKGNFSSSQFTFQLPLTGECGVRRKRTMNPRGVTMEATVVVMFHTLFLTQVDRAFHIKCLYTEADKEVTQTLRVSMLPTTELPSLEGEAAASDPAMPTCKYEVMRNGADGEPIRFGVIGERIYHKWSCEGETAENFCMTVHSCVVDDGQGVGHQFIDVKGCAMDPILLNNIDYTGPLEAGQEARVFKFADRPTVFFGCQIRLQHKDEQTGKCVRTSDYCEALDQFSPRREVTVQIPRRDGNLDVIEYDFPTPSAPIEDFDEPETTTPTFYAKKKTGESKLKRARHRTSRDLDDSSGVNVDVSWPSFDVIDISESPSVSSNSSPSMEFTRQLLSPSHSSSKICVSHREFVALLLLLVLVFSCATLITVALYARRQQVAPRASSRYPTFSTTVLKCDS
uniref:ZP domain-containing protein n=1 Tax=Steinernema glaseri TaxID=37863 RepID=A0A1I8APH2_9BILA